MRRYLLAFSMAAGLTLSACAPAPTTSTAPEPIQADVYDPSIPNPDAPQDEPTQAAEQALRVMAEAEFPGQNADAIANCGIQNTTTEELQTLAGSASETDAFLAKATAAGVLAKPETRACMASNGIAV